MRKMLRHCSTLLLVMLCLPAQALDLKLDGKVVLVTGSTSNIGYATARAFLGEGATVIVNSNDPDAVARRLADPQQQLSK